MTTITTEVDVTVSIGEHDFSIGDATFDTDTPIESQLATMLRHIADDLDRMETLT